MKNYRTYPAQKWVGINLLNFKKIKPIKKIKRRKKRRRKQVKIYICRTFIDEASFVFINRNLSVPEFSVKTSGDRTVINTGSLELVFDSVNKREEGKEKLEERKR
jgi:hypothetical protein